MDKRVLAVVFLLALIGLGAGVGRIRVSSAFTDPISAVRAQDEATYVHSAIQMARSGNWMTPRFLGRFYMQKPPLLMWLTGLSVKWFGVSLLTARLPVLLAASLAVTLVFVWMAETHSVPMAAVGTVLLVSNSLWHRYARICQTDALLAAWIVGAAFCLARDPRLAGRFSFLCFGVFTAAALMTKNIAGLLPLLILLVFRVLMRGERRPAIARVLQVSLLAAGLAMPWHLYQLLVHRRWFWAEYVGVQILGFGVHPPSQISGEGAMVFYGRRLFLTDPVLCVLVLLALPSFWVALRGRDKARPVLLLSWILVAAAAVMVFRYHNLQYVAPLLPALCILAGSLRFSPRLRASAGDPGTDPAAGPQDNRKDAETRRKTQRWILALTITCLCAVLLLKSWFWTKPFGLPFFREIPSPSAEALRAYNDRGRPNELILVSPSDDFYSTVLPLPRVRYCFLDTLSHIERYGPHFVPLGITVTAGQFVELDPTQFRDRLREWGIDSDQPVATAIVAASEREVIQIIQARPESDFFLPVEMRSAVAAEAQTAHDAAPATSERFFLLARRAPSQSGAGANWKPPRCW